MYLKKISELENKLSLIKAEVEVVKKRNSLGNVDKVPSEQPKQFSAENAEVKVENKQQDNEELSPLQEVKKKIKELKKEGFKIYG